MLRKDSLVRGAFILAAGSLLSRLLGAVYRLPLPRLMGGEEQGAYAVGLFGYAYQIYIVALVISTVGLPLAVAKLVSERLARGDGAGARRVFLTSRLILGTLGILLTAAVMLSAPLFARLIDPNALYPILAIAPAVFLVAVTSAYRGLFQGIQVMTPYAVSQVIEQLVRVATILAGAALLLPLGVPVAVAGASFGAVTGAAASLIYLLHVSRRHRAQLDAVLAADRPLPGTLAGGVVREIIALAVPISLAGLAMPLFGVVDLGVPVLLQAAGMSPDEATAAYGALAGQASPFLNVPLTLTSGFALSLVPAIAEAASAGNQARVRRGTGTALRLALIITIPAVFGLALLARDLAQAFFDYPAAGAPLRVLAFAALFIGVQQMSSGVLQGLGRPGVPVRNLFAGLLVKGVLTWVLVGLWGITGAAAATVAGFALTATLNLTGVHRLTGGLGLEAGHVVKPVVASLVMAGAVELIRVELGPVLQATLGPGLGLTAATVTAAGAGAVVYGVALLMFGGIRSEDLELAPGLARRVLPWLRRWRLIRD